MAARHSPFPRLAGRRQQAEGPGWTAVELGGHEVMTRLHMRIRSGIQAATEGRHALDRLDGSLDDSQLAELRLLVTELLTNSVRHARVRGWLTLEVEIYANALRVVVTDPGPGFERPAEPTPHQDRPGGWGLCLVDRMADRWGVDTNGDTSVWFEVDRVGFRAAA